MSASTETKRTLVVVEKENGGIGSITFELLRTGREIADKCGGVLCAAVLGHEVTNISLEIASFASEVYSLDHTLLKHFQAEFYIRALEELCRNVNPEIVIMGHTLNGLDLAPRLAYKMGVQVINDCIKVAIDGETGHLICSKPVYGSKIIADFALDKKPYIVTQRSKSIDPIGPSPARGKVIGLNPTLEKSSCNVALIERITEENISLDKADAIVAGGRGIKDLEGLKVLEGIVKALRKYFRKVELGASRPLVDAGLVPSSRQIGLTGEKVAPELYVAVGISGSFQHLTGMLGSKKIIAINNNPKAPIFEVAHYGVIGNYQDVVPFFIKQIEELL